MKILFRKVIEFKKKKKKLLVIKISGNSMVALKI